MPASPCSRSILPASITSQPPAERHANRIAGDPGFPETHQSTLIPKLWSTLDSAKPGDVSLLQPASALADYDPVPGGRPLAAR